MLWGLAVAVVVSGSIGFWLGHRRGYMDSCDDLTGEVDRIFVREPAVAALKPKADAKATVQGGEETRVCASWCGGKAPWGTEFWGKAPWGTEFWNSSNASRAVDFCSEACAGSGKPLNPRSTDGPTKPETGGAR